MSDAKPGSGDASAPPDKPDKSAPTTTVGPTITIRGKLKSAEDLIVKGRIDAEITSSKALFIENSGIVRANVNVASSRVSGILLGDLTAESKIEIASDGRMIGDILAPRIVVHDGAAFRGRIDMPNFEDRTPSPRRAVSPKQAAPASDADAATDDPGAGDVIAVSPAERLDADPAKPADDAGAKPPGSGPGDDKKP